VLSAISGPAEAEVLAREHDARDAAPFEQLAQSPYPPASDYDGTLRAVGRRPGPGKRAAAGSPGGVAPIQSAADARRGHLRSGVCALAELAALPEDVHLVGSHGSEFDLGFIDRIPPESLRRLEEARSALAEIAGTHPGFLVEDKPGSVALHHRLVPPEVAQPALQQLGDRLARWEGIHVRDDGARCP
jgi:hypothetical protein